jgi:histidine ammonia-lyase
MAAHGARRLHRMNANLGNIIAVELLCAAQGVEFRAPLKTSAPLQDVISAIRKVSPALTDDREVAADIEAVAGLVRDLSIVKASGHLPLMEISSRY